MGNTCWGTDATVLASRWSPDLEMLSIKVRLFYLPWEFRSVILTVYILPHTEKMETLGRLYSTNNRLEIAHPEAFIVVEDFNRVNMRKVLAKFYQHINFHTQGNQTLDHCFSILKDSYKPLPCPTFGKGVHISILVLPAYRKCLKLEKTVFREVHKWSEDAISRIQDCFESVWQMFQDAEEDNIHDYTDSVICYINNCTEVMLSHFQTRNYESMMRCMLGIEHKLQPSTLVIWQVQVWPTTRDRVESDITALTSNTCGRVYISQTTKEGKAVLCLWPPL